MLAFKVQGSIIFCYEVYCAVVGNAYTLWAGAGFIFFGSLFAWLHNSIFYIIDYMSKTCLYMIKFQESKHNKHN